jgi:hypothetical protein
MRRLRYIGNTSGILTGKRFGRLGGEPAKAPRKGRRR